MSEGNDDIAVCSACSCQMDVSILAPFTNVQCPNCGTQIRVKCELDQYVIQRRQGEGGMSLVFAAKDSELGREVAIKILNESYSADETRIAQFEQEAMITAGISHPNVVRVYTVGKAFNRYYIAMELVSGKSMEQMMHDRGALPEAEIIPKMLQVTEGLNAAYQVGLIHRDIKPGNILIDSLDKPKIVDFGLALVTQGGFATADEIWATPYYVPPEALDGKPEDFRSDVYALCATMFHALAGKPPFTTETKSTTELAEIKKHLPKLKEVAPWLSDSVCAVIDKGLEYEPEDRFSSYQEMIEAIQFAVDTLGVEGASLPVHGSDRAKRRVSGINHSFKWLLPTLLGCLALVVGGYFVIGSARKNTQRQSPAQTPPPVQEEETSITIDQDLRAKIRRSYGSAEALVKQGNYARAANAFERSMGIKGHPEPSATIAGLHAITCELLGGSFQGARKARRAVIEKLNSADYEQVSFEKEKLLAELEKCFSVQAYLPATDELDDSPEASTVLLMMAAVRNAELGRWQDAVKLFDALSLVAAEDLGRHEVSVKTYQKEAAKYISDIELVQKIQANKIANVLSISRAEELIEETKVVQFQSNLRRAPWIKDIYLRRYESHKEKLLLEAKEKIRQELANEAKKRSFEEVYGHLQQDFEEKKYKEVAKSMEANEFSNKDDQLKRKEFVWLLENAAKYFKDFEEYLGGESIEKEVLDIEGNKYDRVIRVMPDGLFVSHSRGSKVLTWSQVEPETLLVLVSSVVQNLTSFEKNIIYEHAACFGYLNQLDKNDKIVEFLSKEDEFFAAKWKSCMEVLDGVLFAKDTE